MEPYQASSTTDFIAAEAAGAIERGVEILRRGGLVAFPTDTVYGVGAVVWNEAAVAQIYVAKGRPPDKAIPILVAGLDEVAPLTVGVTAQMERLAERFWPGALTLVVPSSASVPGIVTAGGASVAVRVPDHPVALRLLVLLREPLAATSANRSGAANPQTAHEVMQQLGGRIDLVLDGGACPEGVPSTVLDLTVSPPRVLRAGPVTAEMLEAVLGERVDAVRIDI